jgi:hypothetical protein
MESLKPGRWWCSRPRATPTSTTATGEEGRSLRYAADAAERLATLIDAEGEIPPAPQSENIVDQVTEYFNAETVRPMAGADGWRPP